MIANAEKDNELKITDLKEFFSIFLSTKKKSSKPSKIIIGNLKKKPYWQI